jgi:hypothetical protein
LYFRNYSIGSHWLTTMPQGGAQWWRPLFGLASEAALHRWLRLRPRERGNAPGSLPDSGYQAAVTVTCCDSPPSLEAAGLESGAAGGLAVWEYALTLNRNASSKVAAWHILTAGSDFLSRKNAESCPFLIIMFPSVRVSARSR